MYKNVVAIELTGPNNYKADFVFIVNKGLIHNNVFDQFEGEPYEESTALEMH